MTPEERRQYAREYRECGAGKLNDRAYRLRHSDQYRKYMRELMRKKRMHSRDGSASQSDS